MAAANSHRVETHSHQARLNSVCPRPLNLTSHSLSKSSSSLACIEQVSADERQSNRQDLKKSLSSSVCQTQASENNVGSLPSSEWSSMQCGKVESSPAIRSTSDQSLGDNVQKTTNCVLTVDQTPISLEGKDKRMHIKSSTVENISSVCGAHQQSVTRMEGLEAAVQRSHSDLTCSCKQQSAVTHLETSATHSIKSSSNSSYDTLMDNSSLQKQECSSGPYENTPNYQHQTTQILAVHRDQKVPTNSFDSGGVTYNTTIYTDPGTFHSATLGPHMPGSGFPNIKMHSQSAGLNQGIMVYNNASSSIYSPTVMTIHNSIALPCSARQDSAMKIDGTVPAYCHSLPIPSLQLVPRLVCSVSESGREQVTPTYCQSLPTSGMLTFPKLVSSVSESGLDAKRILKCCSVPRENLAAAQHCIQQETKAAYIMLHNQQCSDMMMKTKDTWTMTSMNDLTKSLKSSLEHKDAEVQTISTVECKSVATSPSVAAEGRPHVFPEVNLEQDQEAPKSPVREVRWDDEGMTWEVYGAAVDPEVLGLAIQKHLEIQIEQLQTEPIEISRKSTESSPPAKEAKKRPFRTVMHSLRYPSCCARSSTAVE